MANEKKSYNLQNNSQMTTKKIQFAEKFGKRKKRNTIYRKIRQMTKKKYNLPKNSANDKKIQFAENGFTIIHYVLLVFFKNRCIISVFLVYY